MVIWFVTKLIRLGATIYALQYTCCEHLNCTPLESCFAILQLILKCFVFVSIKIKYLRAFEKREI